MQLTSTEKKTHTLSATTLNNAIGTLQRDGFVIFNDVMPRSWVDNTRYLFASELEASHHYQSEIQHTQKGHGGFQPPLTMPFLDPFIIENPIVFQTLERLFGEHFFGCLPYGCNASFPGSEEQNVHRDCGHIFPEESVAMPPMLVVVNILLDDFTKENGATEIWPGSHCRVDADKEETNTLKISPSRWSKHSSTQTIAPSGSIVLRDMRTWHRAPANTTSKIRTMLSLVYYRPYFLPDNLTTDHEPINEADWEHLSLRAQWTYRLRKSPMNAAKAW